MEEQRGLVQPQESQGPNKRSKAQFALPGLQDTLFIEWNVHVAEDMGVHGMIIGRDILSFLRTNINSLNRLSVEMDERCLSSPLMLLQKPTVTQKKLWQCRNQPSESSGSLFDAKCAAADLISMKR